MDLLLRDTIGVFPNAFTNEFCDKLIGLYHQAVDKNESYEGFTGYGVNHTVKKSIDWGLLGSNLPESAECVGIVHKTFLDYIGIYCASFPHQDKIDRHYMFNADNYFEFFQVTRYEKGSGHYGSWHCETSSYVMSRRIFVFLIYLNDVKEGGETDRPRLSSRSSRHPAEEPCFARLRSWGESSRDDQHPHAQRV